MNALLSVLIDRYLMVEGGERGLGEERCEEVRERIKNRDGIKLGCRKVKESGAQRRGEK